MIDELDNLTTGTSMADQTLARMLHDLGGAMWFGGSLMGAAALPPASRAASRPQDRIAVEDAAWKAWQPFQMAGIAAHLVGGAMLTAGNKARLGFQRGAGMRTAAKTATTTAALGATAYMAREGAKLREDAPAETSVDPEPSTPQATAQRQQRLQKARWAVPALTGTAMALASRQGEKQRTTQVISDTARRLLPTMAAK